MAVIFNGENVGIAFPIAKQDRLQWKCDNVKSLYYEFFDYKGDGLYEVLVGLDTRNVTNMTYAFSGCSNLTTIPQLNTGNVTNMSSMFHNCGNLTTIPQLNTSSVTNMSSMFGSCSKLTTIPQLDTGKVTNMSSMFTSCYKLTTIPQLNTSSVTNMSYMLYYCNYLIEVPQLNTGNVTNMSSMFGYCGKLVTINSLDMYSVSSNSQMLTGCYDLQNLKLKNIRRAGLNLRDASKLTDESLINTAKELWDMTGSTSRSLTVSTTSNARFNEIYVKLITATDEMITEDQYINNKKPCEVCESTDEGAMTLREYVVSKNWTLGT